MLHDENYKRLFASKLMVEHLLRACLPADLLAVADFSELGELSTEYVSDELLKRHGDTVWRLRLGQRWVYLLVLLEFQSEDDPWMALRILTYTGLLYQELVRNEAPEVADGRLPPLLPVVLYNATEPWTAARRMSGLVAPGAQEVRAADPLGWAALAGRAPRRLAAGRGVERRAGDADVAAGDAVPRRHHLLQPRDRAQPAGPGGAPQPR